MFYKQQQKNKTYLQSLLQVMVFGEITTSAKVDYEAVVRKTCRDIGFISEDVGLDADKCKVVPLGFACLLHHIPKPATDVCHEIIVSLSLHRLLWQRAMHTALSCKRQDAA
jgi:hypothetical protein